MRSFMICSMAVTFALFSACKQRSKNEAATSNVSTSVVEDASMKHECPGTTTPHFFENIPVVGKKDLDNGHEIRLFTGAERNWILITLQFGSDKSARDRAFAWLNSIKDKKTVTCANVDEIDFSNGSDVRIRSSMKVDIAKLEQNILAPDVSEGVACAHDLNYAKDQRAVTKFTTKEGFPFLKTIPRVDRNHSFQIASWPSKSDIAFVDIEFNKPEDELKRLGSRWDLSPERLKYEKPGLFSSHNPNNDDNHRQLCVEATSVNYKNNRIRAGAKLKAFY